MPRLSAKFTNAMSQHIAGMVAVPKLQAILTDPSFDSFDLRVPGFSKRRRPDGWFHPSTHPLWTERQLYYYLTQPDDLIQDPFEASGALAVTVGSTVHDTIQQAALQAGLLERFPNCACGGRHNDAEQLLVDEEAGTRGHSDGAWKETGDGLEIKTAHSGIVDAINKATFGEDRLAVYRERKPVYYAQNQEYLRMSGRDRMLVVFVGTQYPYSFAEVHVPYDRVFALGIRDKYLRVRQAVADGNLPNQCCGGQQGCPVRGICNGYI